MLNVEREKKAQGTHIQTYSTTQQTKPLAPNQFERFFFFFRFSIQFFVLVFTVRFNCSIFSLSFIIPFELLSFYRYYFDLIIRLGVCLFNLLIEMDKLAFFKSPLIRI